MIARSEGVNVHVKQTYNTEYTEETARILAFTCCRPCLLRVRQAAHRRWVCPVRSRHEPHHHQSLRYTVMKRVKNSLGIGRWAPKSPASFQPATTQTPVVNRWLTRPSERQTGCTTSSTASSFTVPEKSTRTTSMESSTLPVIASGLHADPTYASGSLSNPDDSLRRRAIDTNKKGVELATQVGASFTDA